MTFEFSFKLKAWRDSILAMIFVMINGCNSFLAIEALIRESKDLELFVGFPNIWSIKSAIQVVLHKCLVLLQVPKCFGLVQIFCARPKIYLHFVPDQKMICIQ